MPSKQLLRLMCAVIIFLNTACDPSSADSEFQLLEDGTGEFIFFKDSFERQDLESGTYENKMFGYKAFIWDWGDPVVGSSYRNIAAVIMGNDKMGEASHGDKALYFYGRSGRSIHNIYLVTHAYNLTNVDLIDVQFDYLTFSLNDSADVKDKVDEYLRFEVCTSTLDACGVGTNSFDFDKFESSVWMRLFESDRAKQNNSLNGKNHTANDWIKEKLRINVSDFNRRDQVIFRWTTRMRDGFVDNNVSKSLEDGVALDNIRGRAIDFFENNDEDPVGPEDDDGEIVEEEPGADIDP